MFYLWPTKLSRKSNGGFSKIADIVIFETPTLSSLMSASGNPPPTLPKKCWCTLWMVPNRSFTNANWDQLSMTSPTRMMFLTFICLFIFSNIAYSKPYVPWKKEVGWELQSSFPWKPLYDSFSWSRLIKKRSLSNNSKYFLFVYFAFLENYNSRSTYKNFGHTYIND